MILFNQCIKTLKEDAFLQFIHFSKHQRLRSILLLHLRHGKVPHIKPVSRHQPMLVNCIYSIIPITHEPDLFTFLPQHRRIGQHDIRLILIADNVKHPFLREMTRCTLEYTDTFDVTHIDRLPLCK